MKDNKARRLLSRVRGFSRFGSESPRVSAANISESIRERRCFILQNEAFNPRPGPFKPTKRAPESRLAGFGRPKFNPLFKRKQVLSSALRGRRWPMRHRIRNGWPCRLCRFSHSRRHKWFCYDTWHRWLLPLPYSASYRGR